MIAKNPVPAHRLDVDPSASPSVQHLSSPDGQVSADAIRFVKQSANGGIAYILSDQVGQPQKMVDQSGTIAWDRISSPFGETASMVACGSSDLSLRFPGQQIDSVTGLAYNYFRHYDPSLGRYIQSDPIGLGGGANTYAYVGGSPVNRIDPLGLQSNDEILEDLAGQQEFEHECGCDIEDAFNPEDFVGPDDDYIWIFGALAFGSNKSAAAAASRSSGGKQISSIARSIGTGYAFDKHVIKNGEFGNQFATHQSFSGHIQKVMDNGVSKSLQRGRRAYYNPTTNT